MSDIIANARSWLVLGAGELGMAILRALAERINQRANIRIAVLLRPLPERGPAPAKRRQADEIDSLGIDILRADLASISVDELAAIFSPFDTVIGCTGFVGGRGTQRKLTSAALLAGVTRYVPWQFGVDYDAVGRGSGQDVWDEQLDVRDMLRGQTRTRWIIVSTGMFMNFLFEPSFGVVDLAKDRVLALGGWDNKVTVTTPEDIGRLTAEILFAEPKIVDQVVYVAGDTITYAALADAIDRVLGRKVVRVERTVEDLQRDLAGQPGDEMRKYRLAFARRTGVAWEMGRTFNAMKGLHVTDVPSWILGRLG